MDWWIRSHLGSVSPLLLLLALKSVNLLQEQYRYSALFLKPWCRDRPISTSFSASIDLKLALATVSQASTQARIIELWYNLNVLMQQLHHTLQKTFSPSWVTGLPTAVLLIWMASMVGAVGTQISLSPGQLPTRFSLYMTICYTQALWPQWVIHSESGSSRLLRTNIPLSAKTPHASAGQPMPATSYSQSNGNCQPAWPGSSALSPAPNSASFDSSVEPHFLYPGSIYHWSS